MFSFFTAFIGKQFKTINCSLFEKKRYSQHGEDGVLVELFNLIGTPTKYFVEFGVESGKECNSRYLREKYGWKGLLMDGGYEDLSINLRKEFITAENINALFEKYEVPQEFDLLSIDIDYNDFYVWHAIKHRPRLVVIEYNASHAPSEDKVVPYNPNACWDKTNYYGASILALHKLGRSKGYTLVYAERKGVNLFFLRDDLLEELKRKGRSFVNLNAISKLYRSPRHIDRTKDHPPDPLNRPFTSSETLLL